MFDVISVSKNILNNSFKKQKKMKGRVIGSYFKICLRIF